MKSAYSYVIIKENNPYMERESTLLHNNYKASKRYAFINKLVHTDGSESIAFIDYSNSLQALHDRAKGYASWYNYPLGLKKNIQGDIGELP